MYMLNTQKPKSGKKVMINTENNQVYSADIKKKYVDT